jgi:hypothetical protein
MAKHVDAQKGSSDLLEAQDIGQGFDPPGLDRAYGSPVPLEGLMIEELYPTQGNGAACPSRNGQGLPVVPETTRR